MTRGRSGPGFPLSERQIRLVLPHRPPVLQLDAVPWCAAALDRIEACKAVGGSDPMMVRGKTLFPHLAAAAMIEGLAQCCGLLLRLRWLAAHGSDLAGFLAGDDAALGAVEIPRSMLADSTARFAARIDPGQLVQYSARLLLSRGEMYSFDASMNAGGAELLSARVLLSYPRLPAVLPIISTAGQNQEPSPC